MNLRNFLLLSTISFMLFIGIIFLSSRLPAAMSDPAVAGKLVWQRHNCVSCHTLFGHGGYGADDLTHITDMKDSSYLINYLVRPPIMRPNKHTHHPALGEADASNLVQYLEFVHTIPTLGWPPQPEDAEEDS